MTKQESIMIKLDLSKVEFSKRDKWLNVKVPGILTSKLAYETGIHIGDGSLPHFKSWPNIYRIYYSGNSVNDLSFFENVLKPLIKELYNKDVRVVKKRKNECKIEFGSKAIFTFKSKVLGLPIGCKNKIKIPSVILQDKKLTLNCLRGIADTDFSLVFLKKHKDVYYYPKIKGDSKSKLLIKQIEKIIKRYLNLTPLVQYDVKRYDKRTRKISVINTIELNGKKCLKVWMKKVGFNNTYHLTKFLVWKRFGYIHTSPGSSVGRAPAWY
jgi:hypothetical protein